MMESRFELTKYIIIGILYLFFFKKIIILIAMNLVGKTTKGAASGETE